MLIGSVVHGIASSFDPQTLIPTALRRVSGTAMQCNIVNLICHQKAGRLETDGGNADLLFV